MFLHDTNLPLRLRPEHYVAEEILTLERERLFRPAWQPVACVAEVAHDGDFVTADVLGIPVIVRNWSGALQAFVNVCSHRFCKLTAAARGNSPALRCQYHGWEYDDHGATRRIPEAQGFRPLEKGQAGLTKLRVERCGGLVFVAIATEAPSLREYLGSQHDWIEELSRHYSLPLFVKDRRIEANWKTAIENTLESYHLPDVHKATLGWVYPEPEACTHELGVGSSTFRSRDPEAVVRRKSGLAGAILRRTGREPRLEYVHVHVHPNLTFAMSDLYFAVQWFSPRATGSTDMRFYICGVDPATLAAPWRWGLRWLQRRDLGFWDTVNDEDLAVLPSIQAGIASPVLPKGGLLGTREERIWHFHGDYLARMEGTAPR